MAEGQRAAVSRVLGFTIGTQRLGIRAHGVQIQGASDFPLSEVFGECLRLIEIKSLQTLRGLMTRRLNASLFWRTCLQPIDALPAHADENGVYAKCGDPELATSFGLRCVFCGR